MSEVFSLGTRDSSVFLPSVWQTWSSREKNPTALLASQLGKQAGRRQAPALPFCLPLSLSPELSGSVSSACFAYMHRGRQPGSLCRALGINSRMLNKRIYMAQCNDGGLARGGRLLAERGGRYGRDSKGVCVCV